MRVYSTGYYLRIKKLHVFLALDHAILFVQSIGYEILGRIIYCYCKITSLIINYLVVEMHGMLC